MPRAVSREDIPGPYNRREREYIASLRDHLHYREQALADCRAEGQKDAAAWHVAMRDAILWALVEIEKSRAALNAARPVAS